MTEVDTEREQLVRTGCSITKDWYGEPHGPHDDGHDCWDNANDHYDNAYYCSICGFMVQVS